MNVYEKYLKICLYMYSYMCKYVCKFGWFEKDKEFFRT